MTRAPALVASLLLAALPACGAPTPAQAPDPTADAPAASASAAPAADIAAPADAPKAAAAPAADASPSESLARDLLKSGGRRIGWSASKKRFVVPIEMRADGGRGLDLRFYDDDGNEREIQRVCQPGECEEHLDEMVKDLLPKLAARLDKDGYEAVRSLGWPSGRDELEAGDAVGKLRYERGKLSIIREKKAPAPLRSVGGKAPKAAALSAVYPVPAAKLLVAAAEGERVAQEFFVFKLP